MLLPVALAGSLYCWHSITFDFGAGFEKFLQEHFTLVEGGEIQAKWVEIFVNIILLELTLRIPLMIEVLFGLIKFIKNKL